MKEEVNEMLVKRFFDEVWNNFNLAVIDELFIPDYEIPDLPAWRKPGTEGLKAFIADNHRIFPDVHHEVKEIMGSGDEVAVYVVGTGTHKGDLDGPVGKVPATNKKVHWRAIFWYRIRGGKIVWASGVVDNLSLMQQLGAIKSRV